MGRLLTKALPITIRSKTRFRLGVGTRWPSQSITLNPLTKPGPDVIRLLLSRQLVRILGTCPKVAVPTRTLLFEEGNHFPDSLIEPDKNGSRHDAVPDVQFFNLLDLCNPSDIVIMKAVAGGNSKVAIRGFLHGN